MSETTELSIVDSPQSPALADVRSAVMKMDSAEIGGVLAEFSQRRVAFRTWLKAQLKEGIHYGYPPGCEPKFNEDGWIGVWTKSGTKFYPPEQWQAKPSFYAAGADFVADLMNVRDEYEADMPGWEQLGSPKGTFVYACYLISRSTKERIGEGRGIRRVGAKGGDDNNAIKMAKKSAKVDAVLNAYGLRDLFTQDLEHGAGGPPPPSETTEQSPSAAKAKPRTERVTGPECKAVLQAWKKSRMANAEPCEVVDFELWVSQLTGMHRSSVGAAGSWTRQNLDDCWADLGGQP